MQLFNNNARRCFPREWMIFIKRDDFIFDERNVLRMETAKSVGS